MQKRERKPITQEAALMRMAHLCARAEHCEHEIYEKLQKMQLPGNQIEDVMIRLRADKFVDNARYARSYARDKAIYSGWGRRKIRMMLLYKRISDADVTAALEALDEEEYNKVMLRVARRKASGLNLHDMTDRAALYRHLASRGYEAGLISRVIAMIARGEDSE